MRDIAGGRRLPYPSPRDGRRTSASGRRRQALGLDGLPVDPALIAEAAALEEDDAATRHAELAAQIEAANKAYYEPTRR